MEILHVTKFDSEDYKLSDEECACSGTKDNCATLVVIPPPSPF
jgi:hypothetical protein